MSCVDVSIPLWHSGFGERANIPPAASQLRRRLPRRLLWRRAIQLQLRSRAWDGHYAKTRQKTPGSHDSRAYASTACGIVCNVGGFAIVPIGRVVSHETDIGRGDSDRIQFANRVRGVGLVVKQSGKDFHFLSIASLGAGKHIA